MDDVGRGVYDAGRGISAKIIDSAALSPPRVCMML